MMTASKTVMYFGFYLYAVAALLLFAPNLLFRSLGIPETNEPWIRVAGMLVGCLAVYYHIMGKSGSELFAKTSAYVRFGVLVVFVVMWLTSIAPPQLIAFGVVDALAGAWTMGALRRGAVN